MSEKDDRSQSIQLFWQSLNNASCTGEITHSLNALYNLSVFKFRAAQSLSEPHIDHDNVLRRGESMYLCMYLARGCICPPMFLRTRPFNQWHVVHVHNRRQRPCCRLLLPPRSDLRSLIIQPWATVQLTESMYKLELLCCPDTVRWQSKATDVTSTRSLLCTL